MIVVLKQNPNQAQLESLIAWLEEKHIDVNKSVGTSHTILGLVGDTAAIDPDLISALEIVEDVKRVQEPYKQANRKFHPEPTVIRVRDAVIGGGSLTLMAGPCSVESEEQIVAIAKQVKASGATVLRGGAFKPRTSPYSFQGMGVEGIELLKIARAETGLPIVTEIMDAEHLPAFKDVDIIQVGARNMQNFSLLKELGHQDKPVLLKRGLSATYEEWLMSAEYINELPIAMECEFIEYQSDDTGLGVIGKVLQTSVEASKMKDGKVDVEALQAITFDPYTHGYYQVSKRVGEAFKDGLKLK